MGNCRNKNYNRFLLLPPYFNINMFQYTLTIFFPSYLQFPYYLTEDKNNGTASISIPKLQDTKGSM